MNGVDGLHLPAFVEQLHYLFPHPPITDRYAGFGFGADELQEAVIVGIAQHRDLAELLTVQRFVIVEQAVDDHVVALKNI